MRQRFICISTIALLLLGLTGTAAADTATVRYNGLNTDGTVHLRGAYNQRVFAGEMSLTVDGTETAAYCVDLDHTIRTGSVYQANVYPAPEESPWCEIAYILRHYEATDDFSGSVIQLALWKLLYGADDIYVTESSIESMAQKLVENASGQCPLTCSGETTLDVDVEAASDGLLYATITLERDGEPVVGQEVAVAPSAGTLLSPSGGLADTDAFGQIQAVVDPEGSPDGLTITAEATGQWINVIDPVKKIQELLAFQLSDPCTFTGSATFTPVELGAPRTIGFWKHQARAAQRGRGHYHVSADTLLSWLPIDVFDATISTLDDLYSALWLRRAPMADRAVQQCLATALNVRYGELGWYTEVDHDADGDTGDVWLWKALSEAEDAYFSGDPETAKTICDNINNL